MTIYKPAHISLFVDLIDVDEAGDSYSANGAFFQHGGAGVTSSLMAARGEDAVVWSSHAHTADALFLWGLLLFVLALHSLLRKRLVSSSSKFQTVLREFELLTVFASIDNLLWLSYIQFLDFRASEDQNHVNEAVLSL